MDWQGIKGIHPRSYICGYCGDRVGSEKGWHTSNFSPTLVSVHLCPQCHKPSVFIEGKQHPGVLPGGTVESLPDDIASLYAEARSSISAGAFTASVLVCRKLLMNIAVSQGAQSGQTFISYVEHLASAGYVPPNGRHWVDHIRKKGNEATHEIQLMNAQDAGELIAFVEMLLKFVYEFPSRVPKP